MENGDFSAKSVEDRFGSTSRVPWGRQALVAMSQHFPCRTNLADFPQISMRNWKSEIVGGPPCKGDFEGQPPHSIVDRRPFIK
jgi:hypothetical protein